MLQTKLKGLVLLLVISSIGIMSTPPSTAVVDTTMHRVRFYLYRVGVTDAFADAEYDLKIGIKYRRVISDTGPEWDSDVDYKDTGYNLQMADADIDLSTSGVHRYTYKYLDYTFVQDKAESGWEYQIYLHVDEICWFCGSETSSNTYTLYSFTYGSYYYDRGDFWFGEYGGSLNIDFKIMQY